jgi:hypothetical protein
MDDGLGGDVVLAPDRGRHCSTLSVGSHYVKLIASRTLDWRDVKAKEVALLARAFDMVYTQLASLEVLRAWVHTRYAAVMAGNTCATLLVASLADLLVSRSRDRRDPL